MPKNEEKILQKRRKAVAKIAAMKIALNAFRDKVKKGDDTVIENVDRLFDAILQMR